MPLSPSDYLSLSGYKRPMVNWYPGHIAKAERQLSETLKAVDVIIEVRDARAPKATAHPRVPEWTGGKPRIVVLTRVDAVPMASVRSWKHSYNIWGAGRWDADVDASVANQALQAATQRRRWNQQHTTTSSSSSNDKTKKKTKKQQVVVGGRGSKQQQQQQRDNLAKNVDNVLFVDAKRGMGIHAISRAVLKSGAHVNERRIRRGLSERPLRVGIIGYPNVGKSALINKILGRKRARTANTPGITRSLQWIRVRSSTDDVSKSSSKRGKEFELLDSPGIIPANIHDQSDALLLAACNSIGVGAYDNQAVAAYLCEWIKTLHIMGKGPLTSPQWRTQCKLRYGFDPMEPVPLPTFWQDTPSSSSSDDDNNNKDNSRLMTGEDMLYAVADAKCQGDPETAARKILQDFRSGRLGPITLQLAPQSELDHGQSKVWVKDDDDNNASSLLLRTTTTENDDQTKKNDNDDDDLIQYRAKVAVETARRLGLELPPQLDQSLETNKETTEEEDEEEKEEEEKLSSKTKVTDIGRGQFDGW